MIDYIVVLLIVASLGLILASSIKKRKAGKSVGCGCGCSQCPSASLCHQPEDQK